MKNNHDFPVKKFPLQCYLTRDQYLETDWFEKNSTLSAQINRSIRRLNGANSAELFRYTIVTQVNGVSYGGWIPKEEEFEKTNFVI